MKKLKTPKKKMLKCQFHTHTAGDAIHKLPYTPKDLIKKAADLNYDVLSITCHKKVIFNKNLKKFAEKREILLIPGIEMEINKKHILAINVNKTIEEIKTFDELREYKKTHPECLIIAPHPFFPGKLTLKNDLINNIDIFDAIEQSFAYTKTKNYNKKAIELAKRWKKPVIATSDCHVIDYLDLGFTLVESQKNTDAIFNAIKKHKIKPISAPTSYFKIGKVLISQAKNTSFKHYF